MLLSVKGQGSFGWHSAPADFNMLNDPYWYFSILFLPPTLPRVILVIQIPSEWEEHKYPGEGFDWNSGREMWKINFNVSIINCRTFALVLFVSRLEWVTSDVGGCSGFCCCLRHEGAAADGSELCVRIVLQLFGCFYKNWRMALTRGGTTQKFRALVENDSVRTNN